jgi:hypothetical protein
MNDAKFNLTYIIKLAEEQLQDNPEIIQALRNCKDGYWSGNAYYQFVNSTNGNQPGAEWQIDESIVLEQKEKPYIVLDILKDGRIGGIEFTEFIQ